MTGKQIGLLLLAAAFIYILTQTACTADKLPKPVVLIDCDTLDATYTSLVKPIIDTNCALSGCHVNGGGAPGVYTSYNRMSPFLNKAEFERFVIDLKSDPERGMPPNWSANPGPKDLTARQFAILKCWVEAGYPED